MNGRPTPNSETLLLNIWNSSLLAVLNGLLKKKMRSVHVKNEPQEGPEMRRFLLSLAAASAIVSAASLAPASAMTVGTASGVRAAIEDTSVLDEVRYVCRHRYYSSRRACFWQPGYRYYRPYYRGRYYRRW